MNKNKNNRFYLDRMENYPFIPFDIAIIYSNIVFDTENGIEQAKKHLNKCYLIKKEL